MNVINMFMVYFSRINIDIMKNKEGVYNMHIFVYMHACVCTCVLGLKQNI